MAWAGDLFNSINIRAAAGPSSAILRRRRVGGEEVSRELFINRR